MGYRLLVFDRFSALVIQALLSRRGALFSDTHLTYEHFAALLLARVLQKCRSILEASESGEEHRRQRRKIITTNLPRNAQMTSHIREFEFG